MEFVINNALKMTIVQPEKCAPMEFVFVNILHHIYTTIFKRKNVPIHMFQPQPVVLHANKYIQKPQNVQLPQVVQVAHVDNNLPAS